MFAASIDGIDMELHEIDALVEGLQNVLKFILVVLDVALDCQKVIKVHDEKDERYWINNILWIENEINNYNQALK